MKNTILALDSSTAACSVALLHNEQLLEEYQVAPRKHAQLLIPMIERLLAKVKLQIKDVNIFAFGQGPGSFTGIRIAAATIQGLAFGSEAKVVPICSLRALAQTYYDKGIDVNVLTAFDARMNEVYWATYNCKNSLAQTQYTPQICNPNKLILNKNSIVHGIGDGAITYSDILLANNDKLIIPNTILYPKAAAIIKLAIEDIKIGKVGTLEQAQPIYIRNTQ